MNKNILKNVSIEIVKKRLWNNKHSAVDTSKIYKFDLLVDGKYFVSVNGTNLRNIDIDIIVNKINGSFDLFYGKKIKGEWRYVEDISGIFSGKNSFNLPERKLRLIDFKWYSLREVREILSMSDLMVKRLIHNKELKCIRLHSGVGTRMQFKGEWIMSYLGK